MGAKKPARIVQDAELLNDGDLIFSVIIPSNPATKKIVIELSKLRDL